MPINGQEIPISLNQVHHDQIPMPIPDGASPPFAWTLQPGGAVFDPPIEIEYPNMSGLPAGSIAYFLSFNHDTERFEIISSGHVQADGATIVTDPGSGLTLAGWGCNCPPYSVTGECEKVCSDCPPEFVIPEITDADAKDMENGNTLKWSSMDATVQENLTDLKARLDAFSCLIHKADSSATVIVSSAFRPQPYQDHLYAVKKASTALKKFKEEHPDCVQKCHTLIAKIEAECRKIIESEELIG